MEVFIGLFFVVEGGGGGFVVVCFGGVVLFVWFGWISVLRGYRGCGFVYCVSCFFCIWELFFFVSDNNRIKYGVL